MPPAVQETITARDLALGTHLTHLTVSRSLRPSYLAPKFQDGTLGTPKKYDAPSTPCFQGEKFHPGTFAVTITLIPPTFSVTS